MIPRLALFLTLTCCAGCAPASETTRHTIEAAGLTRTYYEHLPSGPANDRALPLVIVFHGSGDDGLGMESFGEFSRLADREGFIAVYPNAMSKNWNDGREAAAIFSQFSKVDDVAFVGAMIRMISREHRVDPRRVFAAGFSNGGIFVHYLAAHLSDQLAAIADVSGGIAEPFAALFNPTSPMSVLMIHSTKDPMVPFAGGDVDYGGLGRIIDTAQTVRLWQAHLGMESKAPSAEGRLAKKNPDGPTETHWKKWEGSKPGAELLLYAVEGGGHTWPGGPQFLPVDVIGHVSRDFNATEMIWEFFKSHPKP